MCRLVDRLERDGLVERRADPDDRRATRVHISAEGRRVAARGAAVVEGLERSAFAGLDRDERRAAERAPRPGARRPRPGRRAILSGGRRSEDGTAASLRLTLAGLVTAAMAFALMQTFLIPALPKLQEGPEHQRHVGHVDRHGLPAHRLRRDAPDRPARRPARQGAPDGHQPRRVPGGVDRGDLRLEHRLADRLPRDPGRGRRGLPPELRDHPRRVPAREAERRHGAGLRRAGRGRRARHRGQRADRQQPVLALAVRGQRGRRRRGPGARVALRARVARARLVQRRRLGRPHPLRRARRPAGGPHRGPAPRLGLAGRRRAVRRRRRAPRALVRRRAAGEGPDGRHAHARAAGGAVHQPHGHALGLRPLHDLGDPPDLLPAPQRPAGRPAEARRLRLRHQRDRRRPLDAADLALAPRRRARSRALYGSRHGSRGPAGGRHGAGGDRLGRHRDVPRRAVAAGALVHPLRRRRRASPSPSCRS